MWFDESVIQAVVDATPTWAAVALLLLGYLGSIYVVAPGVALAYFRGSSWRTATWPGVALGAYGLFVAIKAAFFIERPEGVAPPVTAEAFPSLLQPLYVLAVEFDTGTFPSGHALAATVFWGLVVIDLDVRSLPERLALAATVVFLVGYSRVALGLHFVADVVGGVVLGVVLLGVMVGVRQRVDSPANATLALALPPVLAGFPAGTPFEAGPLLAVLVGVYLLQEHTSLIDAERLERPADESRRDDRAHTGEPNVD